MRALSIIASAILALTLSAIAIAGESIETSSAIIPLAAGWSERSGSVPISAIGLWYPPYLGFASVVGLVCMIGLWMMKKWAVYTYAGFAVLNQIVLLAMRSWNIIALVLPVLVIFFAVKHVSKMSA